MRLLRHLHRVGLDGFLQSVLVICRQIATRNQHQRWAYLLEAGEVTTACCCGGVKLEPALATALPGYFRQTFQPDEVLVLMSNPDAIVSRIVPSDVVRASKTNQGSLVTIRGCTLLQYQVFVVLKMDRFDAEDIVLH